MNGKDSATGKNNLLVKIKVAFKLTLLAALAFYVISFILENHGKEFELWVWFGKHPNCSILITLLCTFLAGIVFTILMRAIWRTWRQISHARQRSRTDRLEREVAEMKNKAARLQTKPAVEEGQQ